MSDVTENSGIENRDVEISDKIIISDSESDVDLQIVYDSRENTDIACNSTVNNDRYEFDDDFFEIDTKGNMNNAASTSSDDVQMGSFFASKNVYKNMKYGIQLTRNNTTMEDTDDDDGTSSDDLQTAGNSVGSKSVHKSIKYCVWEKQNGTSSDGMETDRLEKPASTKNVDSWRNITGNSNDGTLENKSESECQPACNERCISVMANDNTVDDIANNGISLISNVKKKRVGESKNCTRETGNNDAVEHVKESADNDVGSKRTYNCSSPKNMERVNNLTCMNTENDHCNCCLYRLRNESDDKYKNKNGEEKLLVCRSSENYGTVAILGELNRSEKQIGLRPIVIDGSNVAYRHGCGEFSPRGLELCVKHFISMGHKDVVVILPTAFKDKCISDAFEDVKTYLEDGNFVRYVQPVRKANGRYFAPYDDWYIVHYAMNTGAVIVTNDNYNDISNEDHDPQFREVIQNRILPYVWAGDHLMLANQPFGAGKGSLEQFLRF